MRPPGEPLGLSDYWPAPAKLNLCLHIVGRRPDGYHLLQSAMQFIALHDRCHFFRRPAGVIERIEGLVGVSEADDLSIKAAKLLASYSESAPGVAIRVEKFVPIQAGLGGGSSNAATVLVALNRLWQIGLSEDRLAQLGLTLGADVPLFVHGRSAWAEGIGEQLTPCDFPEALYLVVKPRANVSTAAIFQAAELTRNSPITTIRAFLAGGGRNDCASTVRKRYPEIAEALDWLGQFGPAQLTGTGACVFVPMSGEAAAEAARAQLPAGWTGFVARGVNRSPLLDRLAAEPHREPA